MSDPVPRPLIRSIDHFVLTCADVDATIEFYTRVLGMRAETFAGDAGKGAAAGAIGGVLLGGLRRNR